MIIDFPLFLSLKTPKPQKAKMSHAFFPIESEAEKNNAFTKEGRDEFKVNLRKEKNELIFTKKRVKRNQPPLPSELIQPNAFDIGSNEKSTKMITERVGCEPNEPDIENCTRQAEEEKLTQTSSHESSSGIIEKVKKDKSYQTLEFFSEFRMKIEAFFQMNNFQAMEREIEKVKFELSLDDYPSCGNSILSGLPKILIHLLAPQYLKFSHIQYLCGWILTNMVSYSEEFSEEDCQSFGDQLVREGYLQAFINLIQSDSLDFVEIGLWGLFNITVDSKEIRYTAITLGISQAIESLLQRKEVIGSEIMEKLLWCVSSICIDPLAANFFKIWSLFQKINEIFPKIKNEYRLHVFKGLYSFLENAEDDQIDDVCSFGSIIDSAINSLGSVDLKMRVISHKIIGVLASSNSSEPTNSLLSNPNFIPMLLSSLMHSQAVIKKDCLWICSNIFAGTQEQLEALVQNKEVVRGILIEMSSPFSDVLHFHPTNNSILPSYFQFWRKR